MLGPDVGPISKSCDIKMTYSSWLCWCRNYYLSDIEWSTSFRQRTSIAQIVEQHPGSISIWHHPLFSANIGIDIKVISKWHIYLGFANVGIGHIGDIEWMTLFRQWTFIVSIWLSYWLLYWSDKGLAMPKLYQNLVFSSQICRYKYPTSDIELIRYRQQTEC